MSDTPDSAADGHSPPVASDVEDATIIARGKDAWERKRVGADWAEWLVIGRAIEVLTRTALNESGANDRRGAAYSAAYGRLLAQPANQWAGEIQKATRSRLQACLDNLDDIEKWRACLSLGDRIKYNYPPTVLSKWQMSNRPPKDPSIRHSDPKDETIAKLQEELSGTCETIAQQDDDLRVANEAMENLRRTLDSDARWTAAERARIEQAERDYERAQIEADLANRNASLAKEQADAARETTRKATLRVGERDAEIERLCKKLDEAKRLIADLEARPAPLNAAPDDLAAALRERANGSPGHEPTAPDAVAMPTPFPTADEITANAAKGALEVDALIRLLDAAFHKDTPDAERLNCILKWRQHSPGTMPSKLIELMAKRGEAAKVSSKGARTVTTGQEVNKVTPAT